MKTSNHITKFGLIILILYLTLFNSIITVYGYNNFPVTTSLTDTQTPAAPKNLKSTFVSFSSVTLVWNPAEDNVGVKGYEVYCNGKKVA